MPLAMHKTLTDNIARFTLLPAILAAAILPGCVLRTISITSKPSGALVHLNDEEVGRTPLTVPFTYYGTYDVRLEAEGCQPLWTEEEADAPWWEYPGPDLIAEMIPNARSELKWYFELESAPPPESVDDQQLLDHARQLRATLREPVDSDNEIKE